jgi:hypothetical protein
MNRDGNFDDLVLSIYATKHGVAFVVLAGPAHPLDWGIKEFRGEERNLRALEAINRIIDHYRPCTLVIDDFAETGSRRVPRVRRLYRAIARSAEVRQVYVYRCSSKAVRDYFSRDGLTSKHEIACAIARAIPAFAPRLPRKRKPWMSEDPRQGLFDAAAIAIVHYAFAQRTEPRISSSAAS